MRYIEKQFAIWSTNQSIAKDNVAFAKQLKAEGNAIADKFLKRANRQKMLCVSMLGLINKRMQKQVSFFGYLKERRGILSLFKNEQVVTLK